jgi:hypothetical protein
MFDSIFGIKGSMDGTEEHPTTLVQVTLEEWVYFYEFLTRRCAYISFKVIAVSYSSHSDAGSLNEFAEDRLTAILKCSTQWDCPVGRRYAILHLDLKNLSPSLWVKLGREYCVSSWLQRGLNALLSSPMREFSDEDCERIGLPSLAVLVRTRDWINYHRVGISMVPPAISELGSGSCSSHSHCVRVWRDTWLKLVAPEILNPVSPMTLSTIPDRVRGMRHGGMDPACKNEAMLGLIRLDCFEVERVLRDKAIQRIHDTYLVDREEA